jgi:hypothetical protein
VSVWYLLNPDTGSYSVDVTFSSATYGNAGAISLTGADDVSQPEGVATETGSSTSGNSISITTNEDGCMLVDAITVDTAFAGTLTIGASQTSIYNSSATFIENGSSYKDAGSSGAKTMSWSWSATLPADYAHAVISLREAHLRHSASDNLTFIDNGHVNSVDKGLSETLSVVDSNAFSISHSIGDSLLMTDSKSVSRDIRISDSITFTDSKATKIDMIKDDSISISDLSSRYFAVDMPEISLKKDFVTMSIEES